MAPEFETGCTLDQDIQFPEILGSTVDEVLETMFFTEALATDCAHEWRIDAVSAHVRFDGSHLGEMLITLSSQAADSIAPAFLGLDPSETTPEARGQVILELTNILCGAVLSRLWPESKLSLATPELAGSDVRIEGLHHCFALPEGMLSVSLSVQAKPECS